MTVLELKDKYGLDVLEVAKDSLYLRFGRDLSNKELSALTTEIHKLQESLTWGTRAA